jgi:hypothetical protein
VFFKEPFLAFANAPCKISLSDFSEAACTSLQSRENAIELEENSAKDTFLSSEQSTDI